MITILNNYSDKTTKLHLINGFFGCFEGAVKVLEDWNAHPFNQVCQVGMRSFQVLQLTGMWKWLQ